MRILRLTLAVSLVCFAATPAAWAQTATTAQITGLVTDGQGGVLPGATVTLREQLTNQARTTVTTDTGRYVFPNLEPGVYEVTVSLDQFRTSVTSDIRAEVTRTVTHNVALEVGLVGETVTVSAGAALVLQKQDAAVGHTFDNLRVTLLPSSRRDASQLTTLQAAVTPLGEVAGARRDQSTFMVDGVDVSERAFGAPFELVIPTPVDAIEEFRVAVSNANAAFGRSAGGQYTFITRRGTNSFNGSLYEHHQSDALSANSWTSNRLGFKKPPMEDNRFGGSLGGPIVRNKTFFFGLYEGRRLSTSAEATRLVPTDSLKQGLLRFRDATGTVQTIDIRSLDPRGLGPSPLVLQLLQQYPVPNNPGGDGLNTSAFTYNYPLQTRSDLGIFRIDHSFNSNWQVDGSLKIYNNNAETSEQLALVNLQPASRNPTRPRSLATGLTSVLGPRMTNELRFGWVRDDDKRLRTLIEPQVPGLNVAVDLASTLLAEPIDVGRAASPQTQTVDVYQVIDNFTWARGAHTVTAGFNIRHSDITQIRTNKVIGTITTPFAELNSATFNTIAASQRPGFVLPADVARYNQLYAMLLGQIETVGYLSTRDRNLQPFPIGTPIAIDSALNAYEFYAADTWQVRPTFTLSYGLRYQLQTPPTDPNGLASLMIYRDSGEVVNPTAYLARKAADARDGRVYNPDLAWIPVGQTDHDLHQIDKNNFSPRVAGTWSPQLTNGVFGKLFGADRTVVRAGYALVYDRVNIPTFNTVPSLGPAFAQVVALNAPRNANGETFRAGVDGPIPLPAAPIVSSPVTPSKPFGEVIAQGIDPFMKTPYNHTVDVTVQRTLPGNMTVEVGYIGRFGRSLIQGVPLNQVPYFFKDVRSGQTFAQAYDLVAAQLRSGVAPGAVTPQPWFENLLPNLAPVNGSRTAAMAQAQTANLVTGNLAALFLGYLDGLAAEPFNNRQVQSIGFRSPVGRSDYNAAFFSVRKRFSSGFTFDVNYTLSRSRDQVGVDQTQVATVPNVYDLDAEYGPSLFDLTHVVNSNWVFELPFGEGRRFGASTRGLLGKLISGWYTAGILRATSGVPLTIIQSTQVWGGDIQFGFNSGAIPTGSIDSGLFSGVTGSGGVGSSGNPATGGTGLNLFADPEAVLKSVRPLRLSEDTRSGRGALRGLPFRQVDLTFGKATRLTNGVTLRLGIDVVNALNTVNFVDPTLDLRSPATFGVVTTQRISEAQSIVPRRLQLNARLEF